MPRSRLLVSWIGHADLRAFAPTLAPEERRALLKIVGDNPVEAPGPIKTLLANERFDEVHLLSNYGVRWDRPFGSWLGCKPKVHRVELDKPTDYARIFDIANTELTNAWAGRPAAEAELCIHLSPGTPAMAAIWLLLGKTRYPATFYQTHRGRAWKTEIPFDIAVDFVPELLKAPDAHLQHLAAQSPGEVQGFQQVVGDSQAIRLAVGRARRAALRHVSVLLVGESGTGKEMFARAIHAASARLSQPFVAINCAAIPKDLLESELFGYARGAFTGATKDKRGAFDEAAGGTLFLDEVGECDASMQAKLLRVLEPPPGAGPCERSFRPVGAAAERRSDVRIIAATNRDLVADVNVGRFREDLYYRLAVIAVAVPPLRERRTDIPKIAAHLLERINGEFSSQDHTFQNKRISVGANEFVKRFEWPGNVRQLYNALLQAATMADSEVVERTDIAAAVASVPRQGHINVLEHPLGDDFNLETHLAEVQRHFLRRAMQEAKGVKTRAAKLLGLKSYQALDAQLKRLGVEPGPSGNWL